MRTGQEGRGEIDLLGFIDNHIYWSMSNKPAETKKPFFSCCSAEEEKKEAYVDLGTKTYSSPPSTSTLTQSSMRPRPSWSPPSHNPASASPTSPHPRRTESSPLPTSLSSGRDINNLQPTPHSPPLSPPSPTPSISLPLSPTRTSSNRIQYPGRSWGKEADL
jgi:hypothetical protein